MKKSLERSNSSILDLKVFKKTISVWIESKDLNKLLQKGSFLGKVFKKLNIIESISKDQAIDTRNGLDSEKNRLLGSQRQEASTNNTTVADLKNEGTAKTWESLTTSPRKSEEQKDAKNIDSNRGGSIHNNSAEVDPHNATASFGDNSMMKEYIDEKIRNRKQSSASSQFFEMVDDIPQELHIHTSIMDVRALCNEKLLDDYLTTDRIHHARTLYRKYEEKNRKQENSCGTDKCTIF